MHSNKWHRGRDRGYYPKDTEGAQPPKMICHRNWKKFSEKFFFNLQQNSRSSGFNGTGRDTHNKRIGHEKETVRWNEKKNVWKRKRLK